jgi:holo-[acyl-carrier protein] synthase
MVLGIDVLRVDELDRLLCRWWFRQYVYAGEELAVAGQLGWSRGREFLAGRFAAKEAVVKALRLGYGGDVTPRQATILRAASGAPVVRLGDALTRAARDLGVAELTVSISHKRDLVVAVAIGSGAAGTATGMADEVAELVTSAAKGTWP